jgi:hypothetical protein
MKKGGMSERWFASACRRSKTCRSMRLPPRRVSWSSCPGVNARLKLPENQRFEIVGFLAPSGRILWFDPRRDSIPTANSRSRRAQGLSRLAASSGAIQSDAALRQSTEGRWQRRHSASGCYWQFLRRPLKFACRFASTVITVASSEGNLKEAAVIETSRIAKSPQRECITLDRTPRLRGHPLGLALIGPSTVASSTGSGLEALTTS